jgi:LysM repeat protein
MEDRDASSSFSIEPDNDTGATPSRFGWIGIALGAVAVVLGITALIIAQQGGKQVDALRRELAVKPDRTVELESRIKDIDDRLVRLGSELVKLNRANVQLRDDTQRALDSVTREVASQRQQLNEMAGTVKDLVERRPATTTSRPASPTAGSGGPEAPAEAAPGDGAYIVQSGDTLSRIAQRFGVSLSDLQAANPSVNPRNLQIGQKIVIPRR